MILKVVKTESLANGWVNAVTVSAVDFPPLSGKKWLLAQPVWH